jgi:ADP-heptose:LPS heptosyltransferase
MALKQEFKKFLKRLESHNRTFLYSILKLILRTPQITPPIDITKIKKILILRYDAIGDMIVTLPAISLLKNLIPDAEIHVLASKRNFQIIQNDKRISKIFIHSGIPHKVFSEFWHLRNEKYDLVLSFVFSKTTFSGIISNLTGRKSIKVNPLEVNRGHLYSAFFNIQVPISEFRDQITMLEILSNIVCKIFGVKFNPNLLENKINIDDDKINYSKDFLNMYKNQFKIFFNISSGNDFRKLSYDKNKSVIEEILIRNPKYMIIIIFAPEDKEIAESLAIEFNSNLTLNPYPQGEGLEYNELCFGLKPSLVGRDWVGSRVVPMQDTRDIMDLVAASSMADLFITPDTSTVHIASATNKPVLVLYSKLASFIREWMPYNVPFISVITNDREPLDNLTTEEIIDGFDKLIAKIRI